MKERTKAEGKALSDWLRRCRVTVGDLRGETFTKLLKLLVDSVLLYGAEAWCCSRQLDPIERVQIKAARILRVYEGYTPRCPCFLN